MDCRTRESALELQTFASMCHGHLKLNSHAHFAKLGSTGGGGGVVILPKPGRASDPPMRSSAPGNGVGDARADVCAHNDGNRIFH